VRARTAARLLAVDGEVLGAALDGDAALARALAAGLLARIRSASEREAQLAARRAGRAA
jgi:hypothetical protein